MKQKMLCVLLALTPVFARAEGHEVSGTTNAGIGLAKGNAQGLPIADDNNANTFSLDLGLGYAYLVVAGLQVASEASYTYTKVGPVYAKDYVLALGANYNFGELSEAFYVGARWVYDYSPNYDWGFRGLVGKRIALSDDITWNPEISYSKFFKAFEAWQFEIKLIQVAVHF